MIARQSLKPVDSAPPARDVPRAAGRRVALLVETSKAFGRGVLRGVSRWLREHEPWSLYADERGFEEGVPPGLETWQVDGVISRVPQDRLPTAWRKG